MPSITPSGAITASAIITRNGSDRPSAAWKIGGVSIAVTASTRSNAGITRRRRCRGVPPSSPLRYAPIPVHTSRPASTTANV